MFQLVFLRPEGWEVQFSRKTSVLFVLSHFASQSKKRIAQKELVEKTSLEDVRSPTN